MPFRPTSKSKTPPPEETFEEAAYLKALGENQKHVSIRLQGGETVHGWIEYYDRDMLRLTREGAPNLFIFKSEIIYISEGEIITPRVRRPRVTNAAAVPLQPEAANGE